MRRQQQTRAEVILVVFICHGHHWITESNHIANRSRRRAVNQMAVISKAGGMESLKG